MENQNAEHRPEQAALGGAAAAGGQTGGTNTQPMQAPLGGGASPGGQAGTATSHPATRFPLARREPRSVSAALADAVSRGQPVRHAFQLALQSAPNPLIPTVGLPAGTGDGCIVLGADRYRPSKLALLGDLHDATSATVDCYESRAADILHRAIEPNPSALRADLVRPEQGKLEHISLVLRNFSVPAAARPMATAAVGIALAGGSATAWLASCLAAAADVALDDLGVYPAGAGPPADHWLAAPDPAAVPPLAVQCISLDEWELLASLGQPGQLVIRLSGARDYQGVLLARLGSQPPAEDAEAPTLRRTAWHNVTRIAFLVPPGAMTAVERATFCAGGWLQQLPAAGEFTVRRIHAALLGYVTRFALEGELDVALAAVQLFGVAPRDTPRAMNGLREITLPQVFGSGVVLGDLLSPLGGGPSHAAADISLPRTPGEWAAGLSLGCVALHAAALALARDAGADPTGYASHAAAIGDLASAAASAGGAAQLLGGVLSRGYGLYAPLGAGLGPGAWARMMVPHVGVAASMPGLEACAAALFGCAALPDVPGGIPEAAPRITRLGARGYGVLVSPGSLAHQIAQLPGIWELMGVAAPAAVEYLVGTSDIATSDDVVPMWEAPPAPTAAALDLLGVPEPIPGSLGFTDAVPKPAPPSSFDFSGEARCAAFYACASYRTASDAARVLAPSNWGDGPILVAMAVGCGVPAAPAPLLPPPPPFRRRTLRDALASSSLHAASVSDAAVVLRESHVATPVFGEPGPAAQVAPVGPGAPPAAPAG